MENVSFKPEEILKRIKSNIKLDINKEEGSDIHAICSPIAMELAMMYDNALYLKNALFLKNNDNSLEEMASIYGIERKMGEKATGVVTLSGSGLMEKGTLFSTTTGLMYQTISEVTLSSESVVEVESVEIGTVYNIAANQLGLAVSMNNVTIVSSSEMSGGVNKETYQQLRNRLLLRLQKPSSSGNVYDYERWSREVTGVGMVKVMPLNSGPGTVGIVIADENDMPCSQETLNEVRNKIDEVKPIGATVTVNNIVLKGIDVTINGLVIDESNLETIKGELLEQMKSYIASIPIGGTIYLKKLAAVIISNEHVIDYTSVMMDAQSSNIIATSNEKIVLNEVTYG